VNNKVLIKTAGRTGSHVIAQQELERLNMDMSNFYHNHDQPLERLYALPGPILLHDHTKMVPANSPEWDLIVSTRHSVYDQAVSFCIAKATNNFGHAPASEGEFIIDPDLFLISLKNFKVVNYYWQLLAELYTWRSVRTVYWEDLLPLDRTYPMNYPAASRDRVVNHDHLTRLARRYIDNHNWAIDQAVAQAKQYIGSIDRAAARELLIQEPTSAERQR